MKSLLTLPDFLLGATLYGVQLYLLSSIGPFIAGWVASNCLPTLQGWLAVERKFRPKDKFQFRTKAMGLALLCLYAVFSLTLPLSTSTIQGHLNVAWITIGTVGVYVAWLRRSELKLSIKNRRQKDAKGRK